MFESLFTEKLAWFKQNEKPEAVLIIADRPELIKIVIAWSNLEKNHAVELTEIIGESENLIWEWLWKNTEFSLAELKEKAGVYYSRSVLEQKIKLLTGNRAIYPDGTVNSFIQRYLQDQVVKLFETKSNKTTRSTRS
jgi:hypothetical protein